MFGCIGGWGKGSSSNIVNHPEAAAPYCSVVIISIFVG